MYLFVCLSVEGNPRNYWSELKIFHRWKATLSLSAIAQNARARAEQLRARSREQ